MTPAKREPAPRRGPAARPTDVSEAEWEAVQQILQPIKRRGRPTRVDLRQVVNALRYRQITGCRWRRLPGDFPHPSSVRYYRAKWQALGVWQRLESLFGAAAGYGTQ